MYQEIRDEKNELIGYTRISDGTTIPKAIGNKDYKDFLIWKAGGNNADPDPDVLKKVKSAKRTEYKQEGVRRIGLEVDEWNNYETIRLVVSLWNMLKVPNTAQARARDIYIYVKDTAIPNVNSKTTVAATQAINVPGDPGWPA